MPTSSAAIAPSRHVTMRGVVPVPDRLTPTDRELERLRDQLTRALRVQQIRAERYRAALIARYGEAAVWAQPPRRSGRRDH